MASEDLPHLTRVRQSSGGELPDRLQHPVGLHSLVDPVADQALVEKRLERVEIGSRDRKGAGRGAPSGEDGERSERLLLAGVEEVVRPGDRRFECPLPLLDIPFAEIRSPRRSVSRP